MIQRLLPYYRYLKPLWFQFSLGILFGVLFSLSSGLGLPVVAETIFPALFGNLESMPKWLIHIVDTYFGGNTDGAFLLFICLCMPLMMLFRMIGSVGNAYFMTYTGVSVVQSIQTDMFKKIQDLPLSFLDQYKTGEINAAVMGYPQNIKSVIVDTSNDLVKQPLTLLFAVGFLIFKSLTSESFMIAIFGALSIPFVILLIRRVGIYLAKRSQEIVKQSESLGSWLIECFQSQIEVKAYNLQATLIERFIKDIKNLFILSMKSCRQSILVSPSIEVISAVGLAFSLYFGVKSGLSEGEFLSLIIALYMAYSPIKRIGAIYNQLKVLEAPLDRLEAILKSNASIPNPSEPIAIESPLKGTITFENVSFEYVENKPVLKGIDLNIAAGESVGIVGKSGSGKSSLVNLILRLYEAKEGRICIDGIDIKDIHPEALRAQIAYVPQNPLLFNASISENIRIGKPDASESEIKAAAKFAHAEEFIRHLPNGYDTVLTEKGNSLSGGQRQRIAIARAFIKNAPILILDEATSALDNEIDQEIKEALAYLSKDTTTIVITHRIATIKEIGRRICMSKGKIVGDGTHTELVQKSNDYKNIVS